MRILALDVGRKRIGVALSDPLGITAQGLETIIRKNSNTDFESLKKIISEKNVSRIIVGLPLNMDGTAGDMAEEVKIFAGILKETLKIQVKLWDERLTTMEAERLLTRADMSRKKRKKLNDKIAAQLILQSYLESHV